MSKFSRFMKTNKEKKPNEKYAPTTSLRDENGNPLQWEFRPITTKENESLTSACTQEVQVTGKPNLFRPKMDFSAYGVKVIVASTVFPDLYDKELQDSYGVMTPEELVLVMVDNPGEYNELSTWMQKFQGFTKGFDNKVEEAKN